MASSRFPVWNLHAWVHIRTANDNKSKNYCAFNVFLLISRHYKQCLSNHFGMGFFFYPILKRKDHLITSHFKCLIFYLQGGDYMLTLVDNAVGGFPLLFVGFLELVIICYVYGKKNGQNLR